MAFSTELNKGVACVRCKAQKQGVHVCRNERNHSVLEYPGTSLAQSTCKVLMNFRGTLQAQKDTLKDQKLLQQAPDTGGAGGVAAAMAKLKGE